MLKLNRLIIAMAIFMSVFLVYPLQVYATPMAFTVEKIDAFPGPTRDFNSISPMPADENPMIKISDQGIGPLDPSMFGLWAAGFHNTSGLTFHDFQIIFPWYLGNETPIYVEPSTVYPNVYSEVIPVPGTELPPTEMVVLTWVADQANGGIKDGEFFQVGFSRYSYGNFADLPGALVYLPSTVPEPSTLLLLGSALIGLVGYGRKKFFRK